MMADDIFSPLNVGPKKFSAKNMIAQGPASKFYRYMIGTRPIGNAALVSHRSTAPSKF
jgi:hypothetical protein